MTGWRWIVVCLSLVGALGIASPGDVCAQPVEKGTFGVGLILGEPTGVSAKLYLSDNTAIDAAAGGAILGGGIHAHANYLWHPWVLEDRDNFVLPAYIGGGLRLLNHRAGTEGDFHIGVRAVIGMLFDFKEIPLDVFVELAPVLDFPLTGDDHNTVEFDINLGLGVRYYF